MASKTKALLAAIEGMKAQIAKMQEPSQNPAQQFLTNEALTGAEWLKKGDYSQKPAGMFFDFKGPAEQIEQYKKFSNVSQDGTYALAAGGGGATTNDGGGRGEAQNLQNKYLQDKFARDASQNYQDNISNAAGNIRAGLGAAADAKSGLDSRVISAMSGLTGILGSMPQKTPWWQSILGPAAQIGSSLIAKF